MSQALNLNLGSELSIYRAAELKQQLLDALQANAQPGLDLDLSAVEEVDTAGIQLLLLAQREARNRGRRLRLLRPSTAVRNAIELLELDSLLPLAHEETA